MNIELHWIASGIILLLVIIFVCSAIRIFREYERGVVFTLGRFQQVKGPGLVIIIPLIQQVVRVDLRTVVLEVPTQDVISRDNVSVKVSAVVYLQVVDPPMAWRLPGVPGTRAKNLSTHSCRDCVYANVHSRQRQART